MVNIVIPIYNCRDNLPRALHSVAMQATDEPFYCTIVDDGSEPPIRSIAEHFSQYFPVHYVRTEDNRGVGVARQIGINATTDYNYLMFLDADDVLLPNAIDSLTKAIKKENCDVICSEFIVENSPSPMDIIRPGQLTWFHGKMYSKSFLDEFCIEVPPLRINEDLAFNLQVDGLNRSSFFLERPTYLWKNNPLSQTRSSPDIVHTSLTSFIDAQTFAFENITNYRDLRDVKTFYEQVITNYLVFERAFVIEGEVSEELLFSLTDFFSATDFSSMLQEEDCVRKLGKAYYKREAFCLPNITIPPHSFKEFLRICGIDSYKENQ